MVFAAILLLFPGPQPGAADDKASAAVIRNISEDSSLSRDLPSAPQPKVDLSSIEKSSTESRSAAFVVEAPVLESFSAEPVIVPRSQPLGLLAAPIRPIHRHPSESPAQRKAWYALAVAGHSGAAFDAWSTRRALAGGYGTEANPLLRPFAHSGTLYAATQVSPLMMDYLGKKMMTSRRGWVRKMWWLPQTTGATFSFAAGAHNLSLPR